MNIEFEATFLDIDPRQVRDKIVASGGRCIKEETLMRRVVFDAPKHLKNAWLRVRDEGDIITLSLKQVTGAKIEDQKEVMLRIHDFGSGVELLKALGAVQKAYQETRREAWLLDGVEVTIDTWPGLDPFVEIEGPTELEVKDVAERLGFDYETAVFGAVDIVYKTKLGIEPEVINSLTPMLTFDHPPLKGINGNKKGN